MQFPFLGAISFERVMIVLKSKLLFPPSRLCVHVPFGVTLQRFIPLIPPVAPESQNVNNKSC